ncbi:sulfite exporter TauE/SafE family protein [Quadrisphaera sp. DSM 44207]|uniref:sulfite exporter TauE/SafE family protein n=1 Tax=Quadrisphaera sp. DSM 44207 TaxID=1881057 RepID=UPI00087FCC21|nr:sulfite exporter TauE/SafE family protein [Quadrisphaera sp. DSM 44207]SDQ63827.1 hypothetical protein SAMN05428996_2190 [Quadrisphaera sp. DSM 44207]
MTGLTGGELALLALAALLVGLAKTALGGLALVSVALFAAVLPARESTGALLPLLVVGDVLAVQAYRRHADWRLLGRLMPSVLVGSALGAAFVARVDDATMRRLIGAVLLVLVAVHLLARRRGATARGTGRGHRALAQVVGLVAGGTTMVANAGGPVMSLYLLASGLGMMGFLGTAAWFFALVNAAKVPLSAALGLITADSLLLDAALAPLVVVGALLGRRLVAHLDEVLFGRLVLVLTVLAGIDLLR